MRVILISTILSLGSVGLSQNLNGLPACAQTVALTAAANSGCASLTAECLCQNSGFVSSLQAAIQNSCSGTDQQTACAWGNSACSAYNVDIPCAAASNTGPTSTPTSSSSTTMMSDSGAGASSTPSSMGVSGSSVMNSMSPASSTVLSTMMTSTMAMNGTMTYTSSMNSTQLSHTSLVPTSPKTTSGATSQYTGAASAAVDRRSGIAGVFAGVMAILALV